MRLVADERDGGGAAQAAKQAGLAALGAVARAGRWLGLKAKEGYQAVDPDVWRHASEVPLVALTMLSPAARPLAELPDDGYPPVVFVHGLGGGPGNFLPMRTYFRALGRTRTYALALPPNCGVEVLGGVLADTLEAAARLTKDGAVDVVAHSLGGLVARAALLELERRGAPAEGPRCSVRTLVTLGTPHSGSHLARYANTTTTNDLRPGSPILARLEQQLPWRGPPAQPRLLAFWSRADVVVLPAEKSMVDGAENVELDALSHNGFLLRPAAWEAVHRALEVSRMADGRAVPVMSPPPR